ncbi:MAG TPA: AraC family transcriptional regulator [Candidatus Eisenbergiella merdavium]|uniref:Stage 0 sporulation protein A homolog n=1 Tax=Candidatus Eisenbergiella merdavium TaxID=2838551 RepID=A0A9D2SQU3_9FIRM|nr:AraC family transcriptional regulator [Candidatus Eisenbergiella merdavium]
MLFRRILIVDDEPIQREGLVGIMKGIVPEAEVIACRDGEEAWNACLEYQGRIELILTDICMPGMDGVGLIRKVSEKYPGIKMVFISAYQEFEYARNAIRYGVKDYLLKPFRVQTAGKLLERINRELEEELDEQRRQGRMKSFMENEERKKQLKELFLERRKGQELEEGLKERLDGSGTVCVVRWKLASEGSRTGYGSRILAGRQEKLLEELYGEFPEACFLEQERGPDETERRMILLQTGEMEQTAGILQRLLDRMKEKGIVFWAGVSAQKACLLQEAADAFRQAEEVLAFFFYMPQEGAIFLWDDMQSMLDRPMMSISSWEKELKTAVRTADERGRRECLKKLEGALYAQEYVLPAKIKHRISSMIVSILKDAEGMISQQEYDLLLNEAYELYGKCDSFRQLFNISEEITKKISLHLMNRTEDFDAVEQCISYIREHMQEDLSLQSLADLVHFHPTYLSARIKEKVGLSYSNFILSVRMEEAGRMLTGTDWKVLSIAQKCGFKDSSYFNRIFRREFGMSPEQYRKAHRSC